jgi:hypothetical protein
MKPDGGACGLRSRPPTTGPSIAATGPLTPNGYRLTVACQCKETFGRWITPEEAAQNLVVLARLD